MRMTAELDFVNLDDAGRDTNHRCGGRRPDCRLL